MRIVKIIMISLIVAVITMSVVSASEDMNNVTFDENVDIITNDEYLGLGYDEVENYDIDYNNQLEAGVEPQIDYTEHMWLDGKYNITLKLPEDYNGKVIVGMENQEFENNLTNGEGVVELPDLNTLHSYKVSFSSVLTYVKYQDNKDNSHNFFKSFNVYLHEEDPNNLENILSLNSHYFINDDDKLVIINLPIETANGTAEIYFDDKLYETIELLDKCYFYIPNNLKCGEHVLKVSLHNTLYIPDSNITKKISIDAVKITPPDFPEEHHFGDHKLKIETCQNATGYITVIINGTEYAQELLYDAYNEILIEDIDDGEYDCEAFYSGDLIYPPCNVQFVYWKLTPTKDDMSMTISNLNPAVGSNITVSIYGNSGQTGNVTLYGCDKTYYSTLEDGRAKFNVYIGDYVFYEIYCYYSGDENHSPLTLGNVYDSTVMFHYEIINSNPYFYQNPIISLTLPQNATGNLTVTANNKTYNSKLINGTARVILPKSDEDIKYHAEYTGEDYDVDEKDSTVFINDKIIVPSYIFIGAENYVFIEVSPTYENVSFKIDDNNEIQHPLMDGKTNISLKNMSYGLHKLNISYGQKDQLFYIYADYNISQQPTVMELGEDKNITVILPKDANGNLVLKDKTKGIICNVTAQNGLAHMSLSNLTSDIYWVCINYYDDKYGNFTLNRYLQLKVNKNKMNVTAINSDDGLIIKFSEDVGGCVKIIDDNLTYFSFVSNGQTIIPNLKSKREITFSFCEDDKLRMFNDEKILVKTVETNGSDSEQTNNTKNTNETIPPENETVAINSKISARDMKIYYNSGKYLIITLTDTNNKALIGMDLSIHMHKKTFNLQTDNNGQVKILINNVPGTYKTNIQFKGNNIYLKSSKSVKIVVNKINTKITASKKTFKTKTKVKKYTVTLKYNNKKTIKKAKVYLKVKGKTYKAITNTKGKATFKITKLTKKGKYIAIIKYGGNKYYKPSIKKVKLIIK